MVKPGYKACLRGTFCLKGFEPEKYQPQRHIFCDACLKDMGIKK